MDSELRYLQLIFRRWWLILLAMIIAGGASFAFRFTRPPQYTADAQMIIGTLIRNPNPNQFTVTIASEIAPVYVRVAETEGLLQAVIDEFDLDMTTDKVKSDVLNVRGQLETPFLTVSATYTDPETAAAIANFVGDQLILYNQENLRNLTEAQLTLYNTNLDQINLLTEQISALRAQLARIDSQLAVATDPDEITRLQDQKSNLVTQIGVLSANLAEFNNQNIQLSQNSNTLAYIERATPPIRQSGISPIVTAVIGVVVGAILALGGILLADYLDHRLKSPDEASTLLEQPVLGSIIRFGKKGDTNVERLVTNQTARTPEALEGYRTVQTNLLFSVEGKKRGTFLFTSPNPAEGKSLTVANLAITIAASGVNVLVVDADLRKPKQHEIFGLENKDGVAMLAGQTPPSDEKARAAIMDQVVHTHPLLPNLKIITAGSSGLINPTQILGAEELKAWLELLETRLEAEVVLFDTPPALAVSDSFVLAATTKADVVVVLVPGSTQRDAARRVKERFEYIGSRIVGLVMNRVSPRDVAYGYGSTYLLQRLAEGQTNPSLNGADQSVKTKNDAAPAL